MGEREARIVLVNDDWVRVYLDGVLVSDGHVIDVEQVLEYLGFKVIHEEISED
jgi:hypothetical protein